MTIGLIAPDEVPLDQIADALRGEGVEVSTVRLDTHFAAAHVPDAIELAVLILADYKVLEAGEPTHCVRMALGAERGLLVCMPLPTDRKTLFDVGATEIITPLSNSVSAIKERILAQLILDEKVSPSSCGALRGGSAQMRELYRHIGTLAPTDVPILILGETGTGKELVARELHNLSGREESPYIPINCAELNPELLGSELFGHEKGAFTNAVQARKGLIAEAGDGTVFLDEIGELDLQAQAKLLRVLEDKKVRRVGANRWEDIQARFIFATNRVLEEECQHGRFRQDLFERIQGFTLELPPLRERKSDIPLLVNHFLEEDFNQKEMNAPSGALDELFRYDWPGNVRELRLSVKKAAIYADDDGNISALTLQNAVRTRVKVKPQNWIEFDPASDTWETVEARAAETYFRSILAEANNKAEVAIKISGLKKSTYYDKLDKIGLKHRT